MRRALPLLLIVPTLILRTCAKLGLRGREESLGEAALHPGGIPAGIEQHPVQLAIRRFRFDQRR